MFNRVLSVDDHPPFARLPVTYIGSSEPGGRLAVHVSGKLDDERVPLICLAGYCRNMADFEAFVSLFQRLGAPDWPIILIDLPGTGRSTYRVQKKNYSTASDAFDVASVAAALGVDRAIILGQGHGGQVAMALGASHGNLISGTILIDASPVADTPGLVRMRDRLMVLGKARKQAPFLRLARRAFGAIYPGASEEELNEIAIRTHMIGKKGRVYALFDRALLNRLNGIMIDDVFEAQWHLFNALGHASMMLLRTQFADQLQRATFEHMAELRTDAVQLIIPGQGSPALLAAEDEVGAIVDFVQFVNDQKPGHAVVAG